MRLIILGAGGYGKTVADIARQSGKYEQIYFLDDGQEKSDLILGTCAEFLKFADGNTEMYPAFGNNEMRLDWMEKLSDGIFRTCPPLSCGLRIAERTYLCDRLSNGRSAA